MQIALNYHDRALLGGVPLQRCFLVGGAMACLLLAGCRAEQKPVQSSATAPHPMAVNLTGTQWILEQLSGKPVIANSKATLTFPEAGRVAGNGSCNRFMGPVEINGSSIKIGPLAGTKMMCEGGASSQETEYLKALEDAQHFEVKDGKLHVFLSEVEKPLRFSALNSEQDK